MTPITDVEQEERAKIVLPGVDVRPTCQRQPRLVGLGAEVSDLQQLLASKQRDMEWETRATLALAEQQRELKAQEAKLRAAFLTENLTRLCQVPLVSARTPLQGGAPVENPAVPIHPLVSAARPRQHVSIADPAVTARVDPPISQEWEDETASETGTAAKKGNSKSFQDLADLDERSSLARPRNGNHPDFPNGRTVHPRALDGRQGPGPVKGSVDESNGGAWPVVSPKLHPINTPENIAAFRDGRFNPSELQLTTHYHHVNEKPTLVSLQQGDYITSLCLEKASGVGFVKPKNALVDTGAEVKIMISETIATALGLMWGKDSVKLVGVGGDGGALGQSDQSIHLYLGGYMGNPKTVTPFKGSFSITVRPLVMTARMEQDIRHEVLIGQALLHLCLGSVDCYMKHLEFSPAWLSDACPEFRVRVPCKMTRSRIPLVGVLLAGFPDDS